MQTPNAEPGSAFCVCSLKHTQSWCRTDIESKPRFQNRNLKADARSRLNNRHINKVIALTNQSADKHISSSTRCPIRAPTNQVSSLQLICHLIIVHGKLSSTITVQFTWRNVNIDVHTYIWIHYIHNTKIDNITE